MRLLLAHLTVLKPSETERLWQSASSTKRSTTATMRSAPKNAGSPRVEGKRIPTVGSTWATGSVTLLRPLVRLSAKRMRRLGFAPQNARSLKATPTAAPPPVLPSVQTKGGGKSNPYMLIIFNLLGVSAALEVFPSVGVSKVAVLSVTTSSMGSDYMLTKMAFWNPTTSSQDPVIRSNRGFLTYKWLANTIVDSGFINKPCFDFVHSQLD